MAELIEDYALIGNRRTSGLVSRNGAIDWLCFPRFDSPACFAALLGDRDNGSWSIAPAASFHSKRRYRENTLILETDFSTSEGKVSLVDCMHHESGGHHVLRLVRGLRGNVPMRMELRLRGDYGSIQPAIRPVSHHRCEATAGPDRFTINSETSLTIGKKGEVCAEFSIGAAESIAFSLTGGPSYEPAPEPPDVRQSIAKVEEMWTQWASRYKGQSEWPREVLRSLITLQALTDERTGAIIAAPTTSLPEEIGGKKNWDYRYCWLRDGTFALRALIDAGFQQEAAAWRQWLLRAVAASPDKMQIMYGLAGERRLSECELSWLSGYEASKPVRVGNAASQQFQLDVYGEVLDILYQAREAGLAETEETWEFEQALIEQVEKEWRNPDAGLWEVRDDRQQFTESKVMAWVALDRAIRTVEHFGISGATEAWRRLRQDMHDEICRAGFNPQKNSFVQYFGGSTLDASLLLIPLMGFLPATDPRVVGTVAAIEKELLRDGLVLRYHTCGSGGKAPVSEGAFLACSFWLVDNYVRQNRCQEAIDLFERLLDLRNDVGLLSEEYDTTRGRMVGNFPQALSHAALVTSAHNLSRCGAKPGRS